MFCNQCGMNLTGTETHCPRCNAPVGVQPAWQGYAAQQPANTEKKRTGLIALLVGIVIALIVTVVLIVVVLLKKDKDETTEKAASTQATTQFAAFTTTETEATVTEMTTTEAETTTEATTTEELTTEAPLPAGQELVDEGCDLMYGHGEQGFDPEKARKLFKQARELDNADAAFYLGLLYLDSDDPSRYEKAEQCFDVAEKGGSLLGTYGKAWALTHRSKSDKDSKTAIKMYKDILNKGCDRAAVQLGWFRENGVGVEKDYKKAEAFYKQAMNSSSDKHAALLGKLNLGELYWAHYEGMEVNDELALKYMQEAADTGYVDALYSLGWAYERGSEQLNMEPDVKKAMEYYELAAEKCDTNACNRLKNLYYYGYNGVQPDLDKAFYYAQRSAMHGSETGMTDLAYYYYNGTGTEVSYENAKKYAELATATSNGVAFRLLGNIYYEGNGVEANHETAASYFLKAAEQDDAWGLAWAGYLYGKGDGLPQDKEQAKSYLNRSLELAKEYNYDDLAEWCENSLANLE